MPLIMSILNCPNYNVCNMTDEDQSRKKKVIMAGKTTELKARLEDQEL